MKEEVTVEADVPKGYILVTAGDLQDAEAEVKAEYALKGIPMPEHAVKQDGMEDPCEYCTLVARRAVTIVMDREDKPKN